MKHLKTNVCIVGSGVAGSLCAKYLARDSGQILIVERGAAVTHSWRMQTRKQEMSVPTARHHHVMMGPNKNFDIQYVHALGGTTNYWMGQAPRLAPNDFKMKSRYGILEDWPVSYEELEPYYCLAEDELSIAGASDNPLIPRSKPYPLPPHPFSPVDLLMRECFPENAVVSTPQARPTKPVGVRPACCATTTCQLCPVDSKYTTLNTHIPQLQMLSNVKILTDTVVVKLETDGNRRIRRILAKQDLGTDVSIEADVFILAANALENAALLLRSESIPNLPSVGKFLFDHPVFKVVLRTSKEGWANYGNSKWTAHCYQFYDGAFRGDRSGALGEIWNESSLELADLFVSTVLEKRLYGGSLRKQIEQETRHHVTLEFLLEDLPSENRFLRIGNQKNQLGLPQIEIFYTRSSEYVEKTRFEIEKALPRFLSPLGVTGIEVEPVREGVGHLLGTCKMGDAQSGVVDSSLRHHQMDNLYILGGSAFPTYSPANPTITIAALSIRLGTYLAGLST